MRHHHRRVLVGTLLLIGGSAAVPAAAEADRETAGETVKVGGLQWARASNGEDIKWPEAVEYCADLELAGHGDWRLPTLDELKRLHDPDARGGYGIRSPIAIETCCLWSGESLVDRAAENEAELAGDPEMYHWGFMFDGGIPYYAVHIYDDGRALCTRDAG